MSEKKTSILDALASATAEDLAEIDTKLADIGKERDSLMAARKVISNRLNGKPITGKAAKKNKPEPTGNMDDFSKRRRMAKALEAMPLNTTGLIAATAIEVKELSRLIQHPWFDVNPKGIISLSRQGINDNKT